MSQMIEHVALLVREYDEAINFFTRCLGFTLREDTTLQPGKRWVLVAPSGGGTAILLAKAATPAQRSLVGHQGGGRVFLFLRTENFDRDYTEMLEKGIVFTQHPREENYGKVAVFLDLYGNKWDLLQHNRAIP